VCVCVCVSVYVCVRAHSNPTFLKIPLPPYVLERNCPLRQSGRVCKYTHTHMHARTHPHKYTHFHSAGRLRLKCDGTRAETTFRVSAKRTSPFKSAGASVQSSTGSRGVRISGTNAGYTMFRGSVKSTGYPLHSPVSPSLPVPCIALCHHISTGLLTSVF